MEVINFSNYQDISRMPICAGTAYCLAPVQSSRGQGSSVPDQSPPVPDQPRGRKRPRSDHARPVSASVTRRNERERNRVKQVNLGFETLRQHIPDTASSKKMSKVDTLRAAVDYIGQLRELLRLTEEGAAGETGRQTDSLPTLDRDSLPALDRDSLPAPDTGRLVALEQSPEWCELEVVEALLSGDSGCGSESSGSPPHYHSGSPCPGLTHCYPGSSAPCPVSVSVPRVAAQSQSRASPLTLDFSPWLQ